MKVLFYLLLVFFNLKALAQQNKFTLNGTTDLKDGEKFTLAYNDILDSTLVKNGKFNFKGGLTEPTFARLVNGQTNLMEGPRSVHLILEPTEMKIATRKNELDQAIISGSDNQLLFEKISCRLEWNENSKMRNELLTLIKKGDTSSNSKRLLEDANQQRKNLFEKTRISGYNFFIQHPESFMNSRFIGNVLQTIPKDSLKIRYENFSAISKNSSVGQAIFKEIIAKESALIGMEAPKFEALNLNGEQISLEDFKDRKYILLDFWFTYCKFCRLLTPDLKKVYLKYKNSGLEIIGVSVDEDDKLWKKSIDEDGTRIWQHIKVINAVKDSNGLDLPMQYNIAAFPTLILIDKEGKIAGRYVGAGNEFYVDLKNKLKEIFE
ncbi:TlpA disulfide reductase family protein [Pedobacter mucosus]|uniref:TlpA disulfide reductase family protein n=1 Tax=Pedobacter mucosus TaxID=2895286 RepID=UPI001EE4A8C8|nr:TlpA disulfide reductase family protein [Pedobacter mucosus]UKT64068.1 AhpC/TSA family protein [Pedobacter mucosus]